MRPVAPSRSGLVAIVAAAAALGLAACSTPATAPAPTPTATSLADRYLQAVAPVNLALDTLVADLQDPQPDPVLIRQHAANLRLAVIDFSATLLTMERASPPPTLAAIEAVRADLSRQVVDLQRAENGTQADLPAHLTAYLGDVAAGGPHISALRQAIGLPPQGPVPVSPSGDPPTAS